MKNIIVLFIAVLTLFSCSKDDDSQENRLRLNTKSCVLDNKNSYAEIKILNGEGRAYVTSSNPQIAEILFDDEQEDTFYIIGHNTGKTTITVIDSEEYSMNTIDVYVREDISYPVFSTEAFFIKKGESRTFNQYLDFDKTYSLVVDNKNIAEVFASPQMGKKLQVNAKKKGNTRFHIFKGKIEIATFFVYVVDEYNLYIPPSDQWLTFKLPFTYGVNGITIWRGSGQYTAKIVDETVAKVKSITPGEDWVNEMSNSAAVRVTPLTIGTTRLIITDMVTGQTADVKIKVN